MGLWSRGVERSKIGNIKDFFNHQDCNVKYEIIDNESDVVNIIGDIVIREDDLQDGELRIKIRNLEGNLIISVSEIKPSVIPEVMTGKIIFKPLVTKDNKRETSLEKETSSIKADKTNADKSSCSKKDKEIIEIDKKFHSKEDAKLFEKIWEKLQELGYGYERGSDVPYLHFAEACEPFCDVNDIDIDEFSEKYEINIG